MRQTVSVTVDVELFAQNDDDGLTVESWDVEGWSGYENIGKIVVEQAIKNAYPGDWE